MEWFSWKFIHWTPRVFASDFKFGSSIRGDLFEGTNRICGLCFGSFFLVFRWSDFPYSSCHDIAFTSDTNYVGHFRSVKNYRHITWRATYFVGCVAASIRAVFLKTRICYSTDIRYKRRKFDCERSVIKGTLVEDQFNFSATSRIPLERFSWKLLFHTSSSYATKTNVRLWSIYN